MMSKSRKNKEFMALTGLKRLIEILLTPKKSERMEFYENSNDDNESEMKLIDYQMGIAIVLSFMIILMLISIPILKQIYKPEVLIPQLELQNQFGKYVVKLFKSTTTPLPTQLEG